MKLPWRAPENPHADLHGSRAEFKTAEIIRRAIRGELTAGCRYIFSNSGSFQISTLPGNDECILYMLDSGFRSRPRDADNVKTGISLVQILFMQKKLRGEDHAPLLSRFHRFQGVAKAVVGARLYLDKNHHPAIKHDEVDLTAPAAVIAFHQLITLLPQKLFSDPLSFPAEHLF
jgi:hypothetical protein